MLVLDELRRADRLAAVMHRSLHDAFRGSAEAAGLLLPAAAYRGSYLPPPTEVAAVVAAGAAAGSVARWSSLNDSLLNDSAPPAAERAAPPSTTADRSWASESFGGFGTSTIPRGGVVAQPTPVTSHQRRGPYSPSAVSVAESSIVGSAQGSPVGVGGGGGGLAAAAEPHSLEARLAATARMAKGAEAFAASMPRGPPSQLSPTRSARRTSPRADSHVELSGGREAAVGRASLDVRGDGTSGGTGFAAASEALGWLRTDSHIERLQRLREKYGYTER